MRKILHIDMDAFYAAVEQRDNPALKGKPVAVGGSPEGRGVLTTASYEARQYGLHSAMPSKRALQLCPQVIFIRPRFHVYKEVSKHIREIFHRYTNLVEPLSLDEAYLDVTENKKQIRYAIEIAKAIKKDILNETGLTASAGVSYNKFLAKMASGVKKPNGIFTIHPEKSISFIEKLPIEKFHGIGKSLSQKFIRHGIYNGKLLRSHSREFLIKHFGKTGLYLYQIGQGIDNREVQPNREVKSISTESTFQRDLLDLNTLQEYLKKLSIKLEHRAKYQNMAGRTFTLKVKYSDFQLISKSITYKKAIKQDAFFEIAKYLLSQTEAGSKAIRLLGVGISNFILPNTGDTQLSLPF